MLIYLSKPGGQKEGPFTVEQIRAGQSRGLFDENQYWAWYEGLAEWVPLYAVEGLTEPEGTPPSAGAPPVVEETIVQDSPNEAPESASADARPAETVVAVTDPPPQPELSSGLPLAALDHVFVLTTGDGPSVIGDPATLRLLAEAVGADDDAQRRRATRDVISRCRWVAEVGRDGSVPDTAWKVMASLRPELVQAARGGGYKICVRTFPIGGEDFVALFLFYNKQLLASAN